MFITLSQPNFHAPAIAVESAFWQQVRPVRDPRRQTYAVTWEWDASDDGPTVTDEALLRVFNSQLDAFMKAYNTANSKLSAVRQ